MYKAIIMLKTSCLCLMNHLTPEECISVTKKLITFNSFFTNVYTYIHIKQSNH